MHASLSLYTMYIYLCNVINLCNVISSFLHSSLSHSLLYQIWKFSDPGKIGGVDSDGLYKSLALTALARQGIPINEGALKSYGEKGERTTERE